MSDKFNDNYNLSILQNKYNCFSKKYITPNGILFAFFLFAIIFWLVGSLIGYFYYNHTNKTLFSFIFPITESRDLINRIFFLFAFVLSGFLSRYAFKNISEEKKYIEKISESLSITLHSIGDGVITTDENGLIVNMNPVAEKLCGLPLTEAVGQSLSNVLRIINGHTRETVPDPVKKALESGNIVGLANHTVLIAKDGKEYQISDSAAPIKDKNQRIIGVVLVFSDITEKYLAEESLRKSEERFRHLAFLLPVSIFETDNAGKLTYVNQKGLSTFGYSEQDFTEGIYVYNLIQDEHFNAETIKKIIENKIENNIIEKDESIAIRKDNTEFPALIFSNIIINNNQPIGFRGILVDLSEQKNAENAFRESEEKYRHLTDNMSDVAWTTDLNFTTTFVSPSVQRVLGFTVDEYLVRPIIENYTPDSIKIIMQAYEENIAMEADPYSDKKRNRILQVEQYKADGSILWVSLNSSFIRDEAGSPIGLQGVTRDISDLKQAELEREKLYEQLLQAKKMESIGRLAGGVAHDFNNMLGVIIGHSDFALMKVKGSQDLELHLQEIRKAAERSINLTRQLLAFARKQEIEPKVLNLNSTIEGMLTMLRRLIGEDIDFLWQPGYNLWAVKVDPSQIDQILVNLCVNARDAISSIGKITIETENVSLDLKFCDTNPGLIPGNYVRLKVSDDGKGIEKDVLPHIFEPFFTTKEIGKGTGLGLATIYGAVKQNNGYINVISEINQGTSFHIYFPQFVFPVDEVNEENIIILPTTGNETILLVEDEPSILKMTTLMLESLGYNVLTSSSPSNALSLAEKNHDKINLLITDIIMPEMNGMELSNKLVSLYPNIKCVFISGYTDNVLANHGALDTSIPFLQKPFSINNLADLIRCVLDK